MRNEEMRDEKMHDEEMRNEKMHTMSHEKMRDEKMAGHLGIGMNLPIFFNIKWSKSEGKLEFGGR